MMVELALFGGTVALGDPAEQERAPRIEEPGAEDLTGKLMGPIGTKLGITVVTTESDRSTILTLRGLI